MTYTIRWASKTNCCLVPKCRCLFVSFRSVHASRHHPLHRQHHRGGGQQTSGLHRRTQVHLHLRLLLHHGRGLLRADRAVGSLRRLPVHHPPQAGAAQEATGSEGAAQRQRPGYLEVQETHPRPGVPLPARVTGEVAVTRPLTGPLCQPLRDVLHLHAHLGRVSRAVQLHVPAGRDGQHHFNHGRDARAPQRDLHWCHGTFYRHRSPDHTRVNSIIGTEF